MLDVLVFDWRLLSLHEGEAMSPKEIYRLFDKLDKHQAWKRKHQPNGRPRS